MNEMKEVARKKDVAIHITRQDVIDLFNELEPEVDRSGLKGRSLVEAQKRYPRSRINGNLSTRLKKTAREKASEKDKREALKPLKEQQKETRTPQNPVA